MLVRLIIYSEGTTVYTPVFDIDELPSNSVIVKDSKNTSYKGDDHPSYILLEDLATDTVHTIFEVERQDL